MEYKRCPLAILCNPMHAVCSTVRALLHPSNKLAKIVNSVRRVSVSFIKDIIAIETDFHGLQTASPSRVSLLLLPVLVGSSKCATFISKELLVGEWVVLRQGDLELNKNINCSKEFRDIV